MPRTSPAPPPPAPDPSPEAAAGRVARGAPALVRLLDEKGHDLRRLDPAGFRRWLGHHRERWRQDPVFVRRLKIRDLYDAHPGLRSLEREHHRLQALAAASPAGVRLRQVEHDLQGAARALEGLAAALAEAGPARREALVARRDDFLRRRRELIAERERLLADGPLRRELATVAAALVRLRAESGLEREEAALADLLQRQGRRSGRSGGTFEKTALAITGSHLVPEMAGRRGELHVLTGVTLGAATIEFDQLVVCVRDGLDRPVEVVAAVEVKRNINDLAHGFRRRQHDLGWLTGLLPAAGGGAAYRTRAFPGGVFDREATHAQHGRAYRFARRSFRGFRRDAATGHILTRLYFITRAGPLWGVSSAVLGKIALRLASDRRLEDERGPALRRLWRWCLQQAEPMESPDVLALYAASPRRGRHVLVVG